MTRIKNTRNIPLGHPMLHPTKVCLRLRQLSGVKNSRISTCCIKKCFLSSGLSWLPSGFRDSPLVPELWNSVSNSSACHHLPPNLPPLWFCRPWSYALLAFSYQTEVTLISASIPSLLQNSRWSSLIIPFFYPQDLKTSWISETPSSYVLSSKTET